MQFRFFVLNAGVVLLGALNATCAGQLDLDASTADFYVATLARARDAVRQLPASRPEIRVVVQIRGGVHRLAETVVFGLEDSGEGDRTITYKAYPGDPAVSSSQYSSSGVARLFSP